MASSPGVDACVTEFETWFGVHQNSSPLLYLLESKQLRDGNIRLDLCFSVDDSARFSVFCPEGYPDKANLQFQVKSDAKSLKEWSNRMLDVLSSTKSQLKLSGLLSKALEVYNSVEQNQAGASTSHKREAEEEQDSDFEEDECMSLESEGSVGGLEDNDGFYEEAFTTDWDIQMDLKKKKWLAKETELRKKWAAEKKELDKKRKQQGLDYSYPHHSGATSGLEQTYVTDYDDWDDESSITMATVVTRKHKTTEKLVKEGQQIFTHDNAAFQILSNEMISLLKTGEGDGFSCETVDESLYTWTVKMSKFEKGSELDLELTEIKSRFGYGFIELQLDFIPDFPFYPPLLRVVRPRFKGSMVQSLANIDVLKLTYWNPARSVLEVLKQIKDILQQHAKLDISSERNSLSSPQVGAYLPLEDHLIKLALATEVRPRANYDIINVDNLTKAPQLKRMKPTESEDSHGFGVYGRIGRGTGWAKGVGYGHGHMSSGWNPDAYVKAQREKDRQILSILRNMLESIKDLKKEPAIDEVEVFEVLEGSALIPFLESEFDYPSFIEIARHLEKYRLILDLLEAIAQHSFLLKLICDLPRQKKCVMSMLRNVSNTASNYLGHLAKSGTLCEESEDASTEGYKPQAPVKGKPPLKKLSKLKTLFGGSQGASGSGETSEATDDMEKDNAERITKLFEKLEVELLANNLTYSLEEKEVELMEEDTPGTSKDQDFPDNTERLLEAKYKKALKKHQFGDFPVVVAAGAPWAHYYAKNAGDSFTKEVKAVFKEWTALRASLPLNLASSVFVRVDENQTNLMQALIIGPEGTPYANGLFLFDICFPSSYPNLPPLVNSRTNGGGRVRFNPNLYNDGKVCLSLLGTWQGDKGESWNPHTSTLLQVLVSIQSLIMVEEPYFNEPGYESTMGTDEGKQRCEEYSKTCRKDCVRWAMLEQLKSPPPAFESVVKIHFKLKSLKIAEQLGKWQELDSKNKEMKKSCTSVMEEIRKLPEVEL